MELKAQRVFMCPLFRHVHSPTWSTTPTRVVCWLQSMNLHGLIFTQIPLFTLGLAAGCCINITLPTKVCLVKAMVFPAVMYGCESWTVKKAEHRRIDAFEPWCCRRLLRVPWTTRRSNQSILKEISPECSLKDWCCSWNSSTLATSWEELTHWKRLWCWEGVGAGGEGDDRRMRWLDGIKLDGHEFE